jgi:flagellar basal-body rod modification protein FlgD
MATAAADIFNHQMTTTAQAFAGKAATPMDSSTNGTSGTNGSNDDSNNGATISANDFLTLLVTEMQNQDPTADTDPNEYINQLVQVNSLEQLIDINQTLTTDLGSTPTSSNNGTSSQTVGTAGGSGDKAPASIASAVQRTTHTGHTGSALPLGQAGSAVGNANSLQSPFTQRTAGNLSVPEVNRAAQRVGHALDGRTRAQPSAGSL